MRTIESALIAVALCAAIPAHAHQQGISYSDVRVAEGRVAFDLVLSIHDVQADVDGDGTITAAEVKTRLPRLQRLFDGSLMVQAGGVACPLGIAEFGIEPNEAIRFRLGGSCAEGTPVRIAVRLGLLTTIDGQNLAKIRVGDLVTEHVFTRRDSEVVVSRAAAGLWPTFQRFFVLGVEHIATGYDHILFLLALLLVGGGFRSLVAIVTAFTVAHSVTLSLAVLDVVQLPARLVESMIALSIAWVALENLLIDRARGRWRITFAFGLVHGFGFASILRELHLPREGLITSLLAFNLGVEAGQLVVVLLAYPLMILIERSPRRRLLVGSASGVILVLALWWFSERAFG